jgi:hypothetical protein
MADGSKLMGDRKSQSMDRDTLYFRLSLIWLALSVCFLLLLMM